MRVGIYIDGYNLYYGGRGICGRGVAGWRWLDLRAMLEAVIAAQSPWSAVVGSRVVFCTARIRGRDDVSSQRDQDTYLRALVQHGAVDDQYEIRGTDSHPLAAADRRGRPVLTEANWP